MFLKKAAAIAITVCLFTVLANATGEFKIKFGDFTVTDDKGKSYHYYDILKNKKVFILYTLSG